ncbi:hypothetical protein [Methylobacterium radiotolerans]|uniref:hypothetical protein n=1 Tax=Methylobacterium radiotolerans TaxID=31998 RepID=UPI000D5F735D|nr:MULTISPECIES: hypothetical protein [Methylobacterium]MDE3749410.1 hypothetical protein [Methylobacterium radiotolerans]PVY97917.1 hypothetical protein C7388_112171 [Methylobacterium organophilum]
MRTGAEFTAADADRALRHAQRLQRDPAAQAYGDHLRRQGLIPAPVQLPAETPFDEARAGEFEVRRSMAMLRARSC